METWHNKLVLNSYLRDRTCPTKQTGLTNRYLDSDATALIVFFFALVGYTNCKTYTDYIGTVTWYNTSTIEKATHFHEEIISVIHWRIYVNRGAIPVYTNISVLFRSKTISCCCKLTDTNSGSYVETNYVVGDSIVLLWIFLLVCNDQEAIFAPNNSPKEAETRCCLLLVE